MKKKSLLIITVLILTALLSSVVNAQFGRFSNTPISFILINTLVIALAFFILQAILLKDVAADKKGFIWFFILILSVVLAWNFGYDRYIWNVGALASFFRWHAIVNTVIISAVIYFLLQFTPAGKLNTKTGQAGAIILILIFSAVISSGVTYDEQGNARFIWDTNTIGRLIEYLFGDRGILTLNQNRLFVLLGSFFLFAWLFTMFIKPEGGVGNKLNYGLALIIAADMASRPTPISGNNLITIGQFIGGFAIFKGIQPQLSGLFGEKGKGMATIVAIAVSAILSYIVGSILFKEKAFLEGAPLTKTTLDGEVVLAGFSPVGASIVAIILIVIIFIANKVYSSEGKFGDYSRRILNDGVKHAAYGYKSFLRTTGIPGLKHITRHTNLRDSTPVGEVPFIMRDLRVELEVLMNYMLRLEVFSGKQTAVQNYVSAANDLQEIFKETPPYGVKNTLILYKVGPDLIMEDNKFKTREGKEPGWLNTPFLIGTIMNEFNSILEKRNFTKEVQNKDQQIEALTKVLSGSRDVAGVVANAAETMEFTAWTYYWGHMRRAGAIHLLTSLRQEMIDQYKLTGDYEHNYVFANPDAEYDVYRYGVTESDGVVRKVTPTTRARHVAARIGYESGSMPYEVDLNGYVLKDWNEINVELKQGFNGPYIRKVKLKDIYEYHPYSQVCGWLNSEWKIFIFDMRDGRFHPRSRSFNDYGDLHNLRIFNYDNLTSGGKPGKGRPAFDREALKNTGETSYWGRKSYYEIGEALVGASRQNPYPKISTIGVCKYIADLVEKCLKEIDIADEHLRRYVYETAKESKIVDGKVTEAEYFSKIPKKGGT